MKTILRRDNNTLLMIISYFNVTAASFTPGETNTVLFINLNTALTAPVTA
jgi:hypothetical protein